MIRKNKYLSVPALYAIVMAFMFTVFFELWRFVLLLFSSEIINQVPKRILAQSFLVGLRFDFSIASYISAALYISAVIPFLEITRYKVIRWLHFGFITVIAAVTFFIHVSDIEFFKFFNSRLNGVALQWIESPDFMLSMIWQTYPVITYLLLYGVILFVFLWIVRWIMRNIINNTKPTAIWLNMLYLPFVLTIFLLGARGRIEEKAPLTWGLAFFSKYDAANQLALNPTFTFLRDAVYDAGSKKETKKLMEKIRFPEADSIVCDLLDIPMNSDSGKISRLYHRVTFSPENENPPNVIVIIMESFGATRIGSLYNRYPYQLTPHFDSLAQQGILFTNFYSAGSHTYTGIFCTLYGYPVIFGKSIMKQVTGQNHFWGLPSIFRNHGYQTIFFTTHDPHFDNMQGFLMANGMMRVVALDDYPKSAKLSTLGVPDHVMFDRAVKELKAIPGERFFATLLTASNHGPWKVPDVPFGALPDSVPDHKRLNAFKYADWAVGRFVRQIVNDPYFANTIIILTADNGMLYKPVVDLDLTQFQTPLLLLNTDSMKTSTGKRVNRLGSQVDILATVMGIVRLNYDDYSFGRNLLDSVHTPREYVQFSEWYRIGYIENDLYTIIRIDGPQSLFRIYSLTHLVHPDKDLVDSLPDIAEDMKYKGLAIFQTAYFNMLRSF